MALPPAIRNGSPMENHPLFSRRLLVSAGLASVLAGIAMPAQARARAEGPAGELAALPPGTILISQSRKRLYLTQSSGAVLSWPVAIGRGGRAWSGWASIEGKHVRPAWSPPAEVKRDHPRLPQVIAGGAPNNPMGARALTLDRREIAIHGTTAAMRASIGTAASYGCIRMLNEDVIDLFDRVSVGTRVLAGR